MQQFLGEAAVVLELFLHATGVLFLLHACIDSVMLCLSSC